MIEIQQRELQQRFDDASDKLTVLRSQKNNITGAPARIRNEILEYVGASETDIPFVGELIRVKPEASDWEYAIEKVLHNFALRLIVPEEYYRQVNKYVQENDLRGRIIYHKFQHKKVAPAIFQTTEENELIHKIEFSNSEYALWVRNEIETKFNYLCTDDMQEFSLADKALTKRGLTKNASRHEKDDRPEIKNRQQYVLGWDNKEKIAALKEEASTLNGELSQLTNKINYQRNHQNRIRKEDENLTRFVEVKLFRKIDWWSVAAQISANEIKIRELGNTVPASYYYNAFTGKGNMQYRMIKCDSNLDYIRDMILPVTDSSYFTTTNATHFAYDENLSRYYIAGTRSFGSNSSSPTIVYENKAIVNLSYILAINETDGSEIWRREIYSASATQLADNEITSVVVDTTNSDVYIGGKIWRNNNDNSVKIYDPHNPTTTTYSLSPVPYTYLPTVIKFNNNGLVQWVKQPTAFAPNYTSSTSIKVKGLVLNGNEVALGSSEGYFFWDSFVQNYPQYHGVSPTILRFDKQTGTTVGMDYIISYPGAKNYMTAIAADNDGNYITGGIFTGDFGDPSQNMGMLPQIGESDFFVAKLAASACGTSVSTQKFNTLYVNVYPNPTTDIVNIETNEPLQIYEVYNILGQQIQKDIFNGNNQINLDGVTAGVYFIKIVTIHDRNTTVKIMKK